MLSQVAAAVFAGRTPLYYILIFATMGILVLAAQTSFADFPRLASILARDGYFPRQFSLRGERLAFNAGIVALALVSIVLVIAFGGNVNSLIPLYAIGVFTAFTLSQSGMVRHWMRLRGEGWRRSAAINGTGAVATGIVAVVFAIAKFGLGAWIILILVPVLVAAMLFIHREYERESHGLEVRPELVFDGPRRPQRIVVAAPALTRAVVQAVRVAESMSDQVDLVHVAFDLSEAEDFRARVERQIPGVHTVIVESPYRSLVRPFVRYLEVSQLETPDRVTIVLLPEHLPRHWWDRRAVQLERPPHPVRARRPQGHRGTRRPLPPRRMRAPALTMPTGRDPLPVQRYDVTHAERRDRGRALGPRCMAESPVGGLDRWCRSARHGTQGE